MSSLISVYCGGAPLRLLNFVDFGGFLLALHVTGKGHNYWVLRSSFKQQFILHFYNNNYIYLLNPCLLHLSYAYVQFLLALIISQFILYICSCFILALLYNFTYYFIYQSFNIRLCKVSFFQLKSVPLYVFGKRCKEVRFAAKGALLRV